VKVLPRTKENRNARYRSWSSDGGERNGKFSEASNKNDFFIRSLPEITKKIFKISNDFPFLKIIF